MIKFQVHREVVDRDRGVAETWTVEVWLDAAEVMTVQAHEDDAAWSVLTFKAAAGRRSLIVKGTAETVAPAIGAEMDRQRRPTRRMRTQRAGERLSAS